MPLRTKGNSESARGTTRTKVSKLLTTHSKLLEGQTYIPRKEVGRGSKSRKAEDRPQFLQNESTEGLALGRFHIALPLSWKISNNVNTDMFREYPILPQNPINPTTQSSSLYRFVWRTVEVVQREIGRDTVSGFKLRLR